VCVYVCVCVTALSDLSCQVLPRSLQWGYVGVCVCMCVYVCVRVCMCNPTVRSELTNATKEPAVGVCWCMCMCVYVCVRVCV